MSDKRKSDLYNFTLRSKAEVLDHTRAETLDAAMIHLGLTAQGYRVLDWFPIHNGGFAILTNSKNTLGIHWGNWTDTHNRS